MINLQLCLLVCNAQYLRRESIYFTCLDIMVGYYYSTYYKFPENIKDLVNFTEYYYETYPEADSSCRDNLLVKIIPYLKKNRKHIFIKEEDCNYTIQMDNDTLLYVPPSFWPFSPCEDSLFIGGSPKEYYHFYEHLRTPRFFSLHNKALLYPDSVYQVFKRGILHIQQKYIDISNGSMTCKYYIYENDTVPILSMLEYNLGKPLRYYCSGEQIKFNLPFYAKLESFLKCFCKLYKCCIFR